MNSVTTHQNFVESLDNIETKKKNFVLKMATKSFFSKNEQQQSQNSSLVATPEMCFFCFDVLHKELDVHDHHVEPHHIGISNSAL